MAAHSKAWVCGRSLVGFVGSNLAWDTYVCLLCVLCVVRERSLRRAVPFPKRSPAESECVKDRDRETLTIKWKFHPDVVPPLLTSKFCGTAAFPMFTSKLNSKTIVNFFPACSKPPTSNYFIFLLHITRYSPVEM